MEFVRQRVRELGAASVFGLVIAVVLIVVIVVILLQFLAPGSEQPTLVGGDDSAETSRDDVRGPSRRPATLPEGQFPAESYAGGGRPRSAPGAGSRSDEVGGTGDAEPVVSRPFLRTEQGDRQVAKVHRDLERLSTAIGEYVSLTGRLPNTLDELTTPLPGRLDGLLDGLPVPTDPWGRDYLFLTEEGRVVLRTLGSDGKPGGDGYFADIDVTL